MCNVAWTPAPILMTYQKNMNNVFQQKDVPSFSEDLDKAEEETHSGKNNDG